MREVSYSPRAASAPLCSKPTGRGRDTYTRRVESDAQWGLCALNLIAIRFLMPWPPQAEKERERENFQEHRLMMPACVDRTG